MSINKYNNGKIYKIVCNTTNLCYFGSTIEKHISNRLSKHRSSFKCYLNGKGHNISSFKVLENDNYEIILVETICCENVYELRNRERFYIENNECVNRCIPNRTRKEFEKQYYQTDNWKEIKKQINKRYYQKKKTLNLKSS